LEECLVEPSEEPCEVALIVARPRGKESADALLSGALYLEHLPFSQWRAPDEAHAAAVGVGGADSEAGGFHRRDLTGHGRCVERPKPRPTP
jgi:hypothetical protein